MALKLNPYIHFNGQAEEAIRLYERTLGAKVVNMMRFAEMPDASFSPEQNKLVLHSELRIGEGTLMVSDSMPGQPETQGVKVQILLDFSDVNELRQKFDALAVGGSVVMAPHDTFWGATFGVMNDAFGIRWLFNCEKKG